MSCACKSHLILFFKKLRDGVIIPSYHSDEASGFDLAAAEETTIYPGETVVVKTGLAVEVPPGYELQIRPRSGVSLKTPLLMKNAPGTIDADYRGEIGIVMHCMEINARGNAPYIIKAGDRIAQGVIAPAMRCVMKETDTMSKTSRGEGAYGSTGTGVH